MWNSTRHWYWGSGTVSQTDLCLTLAVLRLLKLQKTVPMLDWLRWQVAGFEEGFCGYANLLWKPYALK